MRLIPVLLAVVTFAFQPESKETWRGLVVTPENRCSDYVSDDYSYLQSVEQEIVEAMGGRIYGPYTGTCFESTQETDIEHIVARSEAHDSGLCSADANTKRKFAHDPLNLTLASPSVNRHQKSAKDAADWLPRVNQCWYADRVVQVCFKYGLTIDQREADALEKVLSVCETTAMVLKDCSAGAGTFRETGSVRHAGAPCEAGTARPAPHRVVKGSQPTQCHTLGLARGSAPSNPDRRELSPGPPSRRFGPAFDHNGEGSAL